MQIYLWQFGTLLPVKLAQHMEEQGTLPVLYVSSWLLTSFGSDFPLFFSSRVLDVVLTGSYPHAMIKVSMRRLDQLYEGGVTRGLVWEGALCEGKEPHVLNLALANHVSFVLSDDRKSHHKQAGCLCYVYAS